MTRRGGAIVRNPKVGPEGEIRRRCRIDGSSLIPGGSNRWRYAWTEVELNGDDFQPASGGLEGTTSEFYALNMIENANTAFMVAPGVDISAADYASTGFAPQPIMVGTVVDMIFITDVDGELRPVFGVANAHDGLCEEP